MAKKGNRAQRRAGAAAPEAPAGGGAPLFTGDGPAADPGRATPSTALRAGAETAAIGTDAAGHARSSFASAADTAAMFGAKTLATIAELNLVFIGAALDQFLAYRPLVAAADVTKAAPTAGA